MLDFDFKLDKNENCILIDPDAWVTNNSNLIQKYRMSGRNVITYMTKVLDIYAKEECLKGFISSGDLVFMTRVASEVSQYRHFLGPDKSRKYYTIPIMQVIGVFQDENISLEALTLLFDKILYKKVEFESKGLVKDVSDNTTLGEVVKIGFCKFSNKWEKQPLKVKTGDLILVKDNISTEIVIEGETYFAVDESGIVGIFKDSDDVSLENLEFINETVLMKPYIPEKMSKNSILWTPVMNYEDADYSEIYCRNQFKVAYLDQNLTAIKKNDIILIDRNVTNYVYFNKQKYFVTNGMDYIEGRRIQ